MSIKFWNDGRCYICEGHTLSRCDGCKRFVCEGHSYKIKQGNIKLDICENCFKNVKPNVKVGGVKLSKKALED